MLDTVHMHNKRRLPSSSTITICKYELDTYQEVLLFPKMSNQETNARSLNSLPTPKKSNIQG